MAGDTVRHIILGAGCAGLSLVCALLDAGVTDPMIVIDQRTSFPDDRTWCFWNVRSQPFAELTTHCWHSWRVYGPDGEEARHDGVNVGYARLRARDFYDAALERLHRAPNVTLRLGTRIDGYAEDCDGVCVRTDSGDLRGDYLFDGRGSPPGTGVRQHFLGQILQTSVPVFDPACPTLMDFRVDQSAGLRFMYVLPLSPTEALVEDTCLGGPERSPDDHRTEIAAYARQYLGVTHSQVVHEEAGSIPMFARRLPMRAGKRVFFIGQAGGASKPSSGYTFLRIQEQCRLLAQAVATGSMDTAPRRFAPRRFAFYDTAFLAAMERAPERFPSLFCRLFQAVPPDALARFLSETSVWTDEIQVVASLPPGLFLRSALVSAPRWLPHLLP